MLNRNSILQHKLILIEFIDRIFDERFKARLFQHDGQIKKIEEQDSFFLRHLKVYLNILTLLEEYAQKENEKVQYTFSDESYLKHISDLAYGFVHSLYQPIESDVRFITLLTDLKKQLNQVDFKQLYDVKNMIFNLISNFINLNYLTEKNEHLEKATAFNQVFDVIFQSITKYKNYTEADLEKNQNQKNGIALAVEITQEVNHILANNNEGELALKKAIINLNKILTTEMKYGDVKDKPFLLEKRVDFKMVINILPLIDYLLKSKNYHFLNKVMPFFINLIVGLLTYLDKCEKDLQLKEGIFTKKITMMTDDLIKNVRENFTINTDSFTQAYRLRIINIKIAKINAKIKKLESNIDILTSIENTKLSEQQLLGKISRLMAMLLTYKLFTKEEVDRFNQNKLNNNVSSEDIQYIKNKFLFLKSIFDKEKQSLTNTLNPLIIQKESLNIVIDKLTPINQSLIVEVKDKVHPMNNVKNSQYKKELQYEKTNKKEIENKNDNQVSPNKMVNIFNIIINNLYKINNTITDVKQSVAIFRTYLLEKMALVFAEEILEDFKNKDGTWIINKDIPANLEKDGELFYNLKLLLNVLRIGDEKSILNIAFISTQLKDLDSSGLYNVADQNIKTIFNQLLILTDDSLLKNALSRYHAIDYNDIKSMLNNFKSTQDVSLTISTILGNNIHGLIKKAEKHLNKTDANFSQENKKLFSSLKDITKGSADIIRYGEKVIPLIPDIIKEYHKKPNQPEKGQIFDLVNNFSSILMSDQFDNNRLNLMHFIIAIANSKNAIKDIKKLSKKNSLATLKKLNWFYLVDNIDEKKIQTIVNNGIQDVFELILKLDSIEDQYCLKEGLLTNKLNDFVSVIYDYINTSVVDHTSKLYQITMHFIESRNKNHDERINKLDSEVKTMKQQKTTIGSLLVFLNSDFSTTIDLDNISPINLEIDGKEIVFSQNDINVIRNTMNVRNINKSLLEQVGQCIMDFGKSLLSPFPIEEVKTKLEIINRKLPNLIAAQEGQLKIIKSKMQHVDNNRQLLDIIKNDIEKYKYNIKKYKSKNKLPKFSFYETFFLASHEPDKLLKQLETLQVYDKDMQAKLLKELCDVYNKIHNKNRNFSLLIERWILVLYKNEDRQDFKQTESNNFIFKIKNLFKASLPSERLIEEQVKKSNLSNWLPR